MEHLKSKEIKRLKLATVWLAGCSGCHMSLLDLDEWLFELAKFADIVYSPLSDVKEFPEGVDIALVEGAVANEDNLEMLRKLRARSKVVISFGDCAITGNVTSLRNPFGSPDAVLERAYVEEAEIQLPQPWDYSTVPRLFPKVLPLHQVVTIDGYLPGCPPPANEIQCALEKLLRAEKNSPGDNPGKEAEG